ncbi:Splicing factor 1 [Cytospora paraplurivora]|uniref:Branchpoint-bridging protein n=1 Tax=Cytospora paraplurivora TaxID=2898453 RepID=A0AAN9U010_9PEZI
MTTEQLEAYVLHFRIEEISHTLRFHDTGRTNPRARPPSPPPEYDTSGRRINTRERRHRQRLEEERQRLINTALKTFNDYKAPYDFRSSQRKGLFQEKVFIPVMEFPTLNFIGQILGPRGQSLRQMNAESGANIVIRGKGSAKEGSRRSLRSTDSMQEPLHCLITGDSQQKVEKAKELINRVIETVITMPEDQNERKRDQLRHLAQLNGTFRDDEQQVCQNCGHNGHRQYTCSEPERFSASVTCHNCHSAGHLARDCRGRRGTGSVPPWRKERMAAQVKLEVTETDRDFEQFMLELGK